MVKTNNIRTVAILTVTLVIMLITTIIPAQATQAITFQEFLDSLSTNNQAKKSDKPTDNSQQSTTPVTPTVTPPSSTTPVVTAPQTVPTEPVVIPTPVSETPTSQPTTPVKTSPQPTPIIERSATPIQSSAPIQQSAVITPVAPSSALNTPLDTSSTVASIASSQTASPRSTGLYSSNKLDPVSTRNLYSGAAIVAIIGTILYGLSYLRVRRLPLVAPGRIASRI